MFQRRAKRRDSDAEPGAGWASRAVPPLESPRPGSLTLSSGGRLGARSVGAGFPRLVEGAPGARSPRSGLVRRFALAAATLALATLALAASAAATSETFLYTGAAQNWTVPAGVSEATFDLYGAQGFGGEGAFAPGLGGRAKAMIAVTPGDSIQVNVGGQGEFGTGGFNGGGASLSGGGASDIRIGGTALTDRVLVAGGGGGAGSAVVVPFSAAGGGGGGEFGGPGRSGGFGASVAGGGGTQSDGGTASSPATSGDFGGGGGSGDFGGGGGGGGWYGGGGGNGAGGGGGSGHGPAGTLFESGLRSGNGLVTVTYNQAPTANGGHDRAVGSQASVALDGGGSSDRDGDALDYEWTQSSGPSVTLSGADTATASFTAPLGPATLEFQLRVCDAEPLCHTDSVVVAVAAPNDAPTTAADSRAVDDTAPPGAAAPAERAIARMLARLALCARLALGTGAGGDQLPVGASGAGPGPDRARRRNGGQGKTAQARTRGAASRAASARSRRSASRPAPRPRRRSLAGSV